MNGIILIIVIINPYVYFIYSFHSLAAQSDGAAAQRSARLVPPVSLFLSTPPICHWAVNNTTTNYLYVYRNRSVRRRQS
uniref:Uncharacterized protein n=1 Tax=Globodera rostochiensis TaxID=31243 RepID=A0A914HUS4_GLORO